MSTESLQHEASRKRSVHKLIKEHQDLNHKLTYLILLSKILTTKELALFVKRDVTTIISWKNRGEMLSRFDLEGLKYEEPR